MILLVKLVLFAILKKSIDDLYNKYRESKQCNIKKALKRYYDKKDGILQKRRSNNAHFKDLDSRIKALEGKPSIQKNLT